MAIIDIDRMYKEMVSTMKNNFEGTPEQIYFLAKLMYLKSVDDCIEANKKELIEELKNEI